MRSRQLYPLLAICGLLTNYSQAGDLRVEALPSDHFVMSYRDAGGVELTSPEPLIRWNDNHHPVFQAQAAGWPVELGPPGLTAAVGKPAGGRYGELGFPISIRNSGSTAITGVLYPPFTKWSTDES